jgi:predicted NUDIX family phosphoesterase
MQVTPTVPQQTTPKTDEQILVVKRSHLFPDTKEAWHGLNGELFNEFFSCVQEHKEFHPRSLMETDPTYKQIIPYLVFAHENKFFLMQRTSTAGEQRLKNKYTLGIGGHIRKEDLLASSNNIMTWAEREFHEEVHYKGTYTVTPLGILNDDTDLVGQVHLGFVLLITGNSPMISVRSELKSGELYSLTECAHFYDTMESWSQMIFSYLTSKK